MNINPPACRRVRRVFRFPFSDIPFRFASISRRVVVGAKPPLSPQRRPGGGGLKLLLASVFRASGSFYELLESSRSCWNRFGLSGNGFGSLVQPPRRLVRPPRRLVRPPRRLVRPPRRLIWPPKPPKTIEKSFSELLAASRSFWNRPGASGIYLGCQGMVFAASSRFQDAKSGLQNA